MTENNAIPRFLIYGAYGYTGALIAQEAVRLGLRPVLGGRDADKLSVQAEKLGLECRAFALEDPAAVDAALNGIHAVLHCAGPFVHTWQPMFEACLRNQAHYLDITGEIAVFENLAARSQDSRQAGIVALPGTGFDVVPSDCLAMHLKDRLPGATRLVLAFRGLSRISQGSARTSIENLGQPSTIRRGGQLLPIPAGSKTRRIDFGRGPVKTMAISWGDVSTAYYSTGIPNIEVYSAIPASMRNLMQAGRYLGAKFTDSQVVRNFLRNAIRTQPVGPNAEERERGLGLLWGEAMDNTGRKAVSRLTTLEPYKLTAMTAIQAVERLFRDRVTPGFQTPALAFGKNFILEFPGCVREDIL
jgi:short subunit dehydrogenase-like uncharacterized protein